MIKKKEIKKMADTRIPKIGPVDVEYPLNLYPLYK